MVGSEVEEKSTRRKDALIAAFATVLAAVIVAGGGIIAAGRRDRAELRDELSVARRQLQERTARVQDLELKLKQLALVPRVAEPTRVAGSSGDAPDANGSQPTLVATEAQQGFTIAFYGCSRSSDAVLCQFKVTNTQSEREIGLYADPYYSPRTSRAFDESGREIAATKGEIAGKEGRVPEATIPAGVTVTAALAFSSAPPNVQKFVVLQFGFYYGHDYYKVDFRDVDIRHA